MSKLIVKSRKKCKCGYCSKIIKVGETKGTNGHKSFCLKCLSDVAMARRLVQEACHILAGDAEAIKKLADEFLKLSK